MNCKNYPSYFSRGKNLFLLLLIACTLPSQAQKKQAKAAQPNWPHPVTNASSPLMLAGDWAPDDSHKIDFNKLPRVAGEHNIVNDVRKERGVNQHNYIIHHDGKYWMMWSDGPGIEDRVGQRVKYSTSVDAITWSEPKFMTPMPKGGDREGIYGTRTSKGFRYIARGFWVRNGEFLALASLDEALDFFGESLELRAYRYNKDQDKWEDIGVIQDNAINNFAPQKLATGEWMMSRRKYDYTKSGVEFLIGGVEKLTDWKSVPVLGTASELSAEEPCWWLLPDNNLAALFRDNKGSGYIYRSFSADNGRSWSTPVKTNFPDARSKFSATRLKDGRYVLVSNANPKKRDPLVLSISNDGLVFDKMYYLVGGRHVDYPNVIEHDGNLLVAFAGGKQTVEVIKIRLSDLDSVKMIPQK